MKALQLLVTFYFVLLSSLVHANVPSPLKAIWKKQVEPLLKQTITLNFIEEKNEFYHSFAPWKVLKSEISGTINYNATCFQKADTLKRGTRTYFSKTYFKKDTLLFIDYGDKEIAEINKSRYVDELMNTLRYTPVPMLTYFKNANIKRIKKTDKEHDVYETKVNNTIVEVYIDKKTFLVNKITTLKHTPLYGDVQDVYYYHQYTYYLNTVYPKQVSIEKLNGKLKDEVKNIEINKVATFPLAMNRPKNYSIKKDTIINPNISVEQYNKHIYFISMHHSDDKVLLVNFKDFILIAEAPLSSENGELIIAEAKKIAPHKPIKYFVFGHFHDHYIGGIRAFVHKGAEIIHSNNTSEYVSTLVNAPHRLKPDSLQLNPKPLKSKLITDSLWISDGEYKIGIYVIGEQSSHTQDYLIYYFPKEKLLFEDDLIWIEKEGPIKKASKRQAGLYQAITDRKLQVDTIIQSWPLKSYGVKTIIPFNELEQSIKN